MSHFTVQQLSDPVEQAYPLIRMVEPQMSLPAWHRRVTALKQANGGALTAVAPSGIIHAVATYRPAPAGGALLVDEFVAFELSSRGTARRALADGLQQIAASLGCRSVEFPEDIGGVAANDRRAEKERAIGPRLS